MYLIRTYSRAENNKQKTSLSTYFKQNTLITTFHELRYFTNPLSATQAFGYCTNLQEITLPESATVIPNSCFRGCSNLQVVKSGGVTIMHNCAFYDCHQVKFVSMDNVTQLGTSTNTSTGQSLFANADELDRVILPKITAIRVPAFWSNRAQALRYVLITAPTVPTLATSTCFNRTTYKIYVPNTLIDSYKSATQWSNLSSRLLPVSQFPTDFPEDAEELGIS